MSRIRGFNLVLLFICLLVGVVGTPNMLTNGEISSQQTDLKSGTINGIDYTQGKHEFFASGNFSQSINATSTETSNVTSTVTQLLPLISSYNPYDALFKVDINEYDAIADANYTYTRYYNNASYLAEIDFITSNDTACIPSTCMASRFNDADENDGLAQMQGVWEEDVRTDETVIIDQDDNFLGKFPSGVSMLAYNHKYNSTTTVRRTMHISVAAYYVNVVYDMKEVVMKSTSFSSAYMAYFGEYSNAYNVSATVHQVNITDGKNLAVGVTMFDNINANYTETVASFFGYWFMAIEVTELRFTNPTDYVYANDSVPWEMYPKHLLPKTYQANGSHVNIGFKSVQTKMLSTFQSITAAFASVSADVTESSAEIEANLAVWGLQFLPTLAAYRDGNNNDKLDLTVENEGLKIDSSDRLEYLGLAEAYESVVVNAFYDSHVYDEKAQLVGLGVNITNIGVNETSLNFDVEHTGYGAINTPVQTAFTWNEPTTDTNGNTVFDFGIDYTNFPVTWINMTNPDDSFVELQDIGYHYIITVNPETGKAKISPTWLYGGMETPSNKDAMEGLSLAWIAKSEFFAVRAIYTATLTDEPINTSSTKEFGKIRVGFGDGEATEIDVTGAKQFYTLNSDTVSTTHTAKFDAITLIQVSGSFGAEKTSPFQSESSRTGGTATVGGLVETLNLDFFYSAALIIVSYPEWNGEDIIHDPDYNVAYQPKPPVANTPTPAETTTDSVDTPTLSDDPTTSPTKTEETSAAAGIPGFGFFMIFSTLVILKRRNSKK
ncbi:MAG: hypothetical protein HeimC2_24720 [Candidatus Heimdallarchaeota archaeon LC_2]|nr:MAG: hypothetical protein HeimC2_24720 [Candidatus Heimdallarchaeota archaeon LC_2]